MWKYMRNANTDRERRSFSDGVRDQLRWVKGVSPEEEATSWRTVIGHHEMHPDEGYDHDEGRPIVPIAAASVSHGRRKGEVLKRGSWTPMDGPGGGLFSGGSVLVCLGSDFAKKMTPSSSKRLDASAWHCGCPCPAEPGRVS